MGENDNIPQMTPSFENICRKDENGTNTGVPVTFVVQWAILLIGNSKGS